MKKRIHIKLPPQHITKILSKYGMEKVTEQLGITETAVKKYIKLNAAPKATEIAAQLLLEKDEIHAGDKTAVVRGEPELLKVVGKIVKSADGHFTLID